MFRTVFLEIKANIPFYSHNKIVELQKMHGIEMGVHHYEKCGATNMLESMSSYMHRQFINHMLSENLPFSIIIDGSTDISESHYLIVYFQILERNVPSICFYRLIETSSDVTASGYFNSIINAMKSEERNLYDYFRHNLIGYVSDGEHVMTGVAGGLISYIRKITDNPIFAVHCMAHRLHLAIGNAYSSIPYFSSFDKLVNNLYKFYNFHSSKRRAHLKETSEHLNLPFYDLNYIYRTRWISSEFQAITNFKRVWVLINKDLESIIQDRTNFDIKSRDKALNLLKQIRGKKFLAILNFVFDVLEHLSFWSKKMQERSVLLVDFVEFQQSISQTFENLKVKNGKGLDLLLTNSVCEVGECESLDEYYNSESVKYLEIELLNDHNEDEDVPIPYISEIRETFLQNLKNAIKAYFPMKELILFNIFRPSKIPTEVIDSISFGAREVSSICNIFKLNDCDMLLEDWGKLIESIIESENFCDFRNRNTETFSFWSHFLNEIGIAWTDKTKMLIRIILVLPIGSADAERGFSIMNHVKSDRRARLVGKHLEDHLRIRINANDDLDKFPAKKYAQNWVHENHMRTDERTKIRKNTEKSENKKFLPKLSFL